MLTFKSSMKHYRTVGLYLDGTIPGLKASLLSETVMLYPEIDKLQGDGR